MIVTVTLNPALDKTVGIDTLIPGHVNRLNSVAEFAGGKGINVTRVLAQYGKNVMAMGFLGGYAGKFIKKEVERCGAVCNFTTIAGTTRTNTNILGKDGYVTELLEPGPVITAREQQSFLEAYTQMASDAEVILLSGSLPVGVDEGFYGELIRIANIKNRKVILDTSKEALCASVKWLPYMIKPNVKELEFLMGRKLDGIEKITEAAKECCQKGIAKVVVSMGDKGLLYVDAKCKIHATAPKQKAVNTVGCGDSLVAAMAMSMVENEETVSSLKRAAAISAANATTLENGVVPQVLAEQLMEKVRIRAV